MTGAMRPRLSEWRRKGGSLHLRYDGIRDWVKMGKILERPDVQFADGMEWLEIWEC